MPEIKKTETLAKAAAPVKTPVAPVAKAEEKAVAKKPAVKKAAKPAAKKPAVKKAEPKKAEEKKETKKAAKPAAKKTAAKKAVKETKTVKAATEKDVVKSNIVLQYADKNVTFDTLVENAQNVCIYDMGKKASDIKKLDLYVKPEENTVYFVLNDKEHNQYSL